MRIGFASIYAWRPHVEHLMWLSELAASDGHAAFFLACDADLPTCYTRELRPSVGTLSNCLICRAGGVRSYRSRCVSSIGALAAERETAPDTALEWASSSASTLGRFETDAEFASLEFSTVADRLAPACARTYTAARRWIEMDRLDAICAFNGRMDATRAIMEAARDAGIRFVSLERTWFGDGLQLIPGDNCLGLAEVHRLVGEWSQRPLLADQAARAADIVASRFLRNNVKEWRAYNQSASIEQWPMTGEGRRILLLPGSRNEFYGHPDWKSRWPEPCAAYDALIDRFDLSPHEIVLRCHPNWGERIGPTDGSRSEAYYSEWARSRGISVIASSSTTSTLALIDQADAIVVGGSSAGLEAGILGRQVIAVSPSIYTRAGFESPCYDQADLARLVLDVGRGREERDRLASDRARKTLRFAYSMVFRVSQYVDEVHCISTTRYEYAADADPGRFTRLLRTGILEPDDGRAAGSEDDEDAILAMIDRRAWRDLVVSAGPRPAAVRAMHRRPLFRLIDGMRERLPRGDRWNG